MVKLSISEKNEINKFNTDERFLYCDMEKETDRLKILHTLKDKGYIRFKGNQGNFQFFERINK